MTFKLISVVAQCRSVVTLVKRAYSFTIQSSTGIQLYMFLSLLFYSQSHKQIKGKKQCLPNDRIAEAARYRAFFI